MIKHIYAFSVLGGVVFLVSAGWLAWVNRGSWPLISAFLTATVGVVAVLILPKVLLKSEKIHDRFPVSVVVDSASGLLISYFPASQFVAYMSQRAAFNEQHGQPGLLVPRAVDLGNAQKRFSYYEELLQYELLPQCYVALRSDSVISASTSPQGTVTSAETFEFFRPKAFDEISGGSVISALSHNRFLGQQERRWWSMQRTSLPVPVGTRLEVVETNKVIFGKPNYFRVTLTVESYGGGPGVPAQLRSLIPTATAETLTFMIHGIAEFEELTSLSPETEENKKWAAVLFRRLKGAMST